MKKRFARVGALLFCLAVGLVAARMIPAPDGADGGTGGWDLGRELRQGIEHDTPKPNTAAERIGTPTLAPSRPEPQAAGAPEGVILVNVEVAAEE